MKIIKSWKVFESMKPFNEGEIEDVFDVFQEFFDAGTFRAVATEATSSIIRWYNNTCLEASAASNPYEAEKVINIKVDKGATCPEFSITDEMIRALEEAELDLKSRGLKISWIYTAEVMKYLYWKNTDALKLMSREKPTILWIDIAVSRID